MAELIINAAPYETRVALVENGNIVELYIERPAERGCVGNIYKGRVVRVLPGMQAAFVEIGLSRTAFLYVSDICDQTREFERLMGEDEAAEELSTTSVSTHSIEDLLRPGQEVLVQVAKDPLGKKGARVTSHITLPGRHLVLMPTMGHIGVSRRIEDEEERKRLREIIERLRPPGTGWIVRTAAEGVEENKLANEIDFLVKLWKEIKRRAETHPCPSLIYEDLDISLRAVRDLFAREVQRLVVDNEEVYLKILNFMDIFAPHLRAHVDLYEGEVPIFEAFGIEMEVSRALSKKIWLKSGGYIIIETTEALTAIDVNTGRYVGKRDLEETVLKTNLEAVKEIAYQLRLRNIGGLIIIDFIDMEKEESREKVFTALKEALKKDRSRTNILRMSELGLIQMTRQRLRESLYDLLCEPCFYCEGTGRLKSRRTICYEIFRRLEREARRRIAKSIHLKVHPQVAELLLNEEATHLEALEKGLGKTIIITSSPDLHLEQYELDYLDVDMKH